MFVVKASVKILLLRVAWNVKKIVRISVLEHVGTLIPSDNGIWEFAMNSFKFRRIYVKCTPIFAKLRLCSNYVCAKGNSYYALFFVSCLN